MYNFILKKMSVYVLHRNNTLDHQKGRPAILLKYKKNHCLVWTGTSKIDLFTKEKPIIIKINRDEGYYYSTGIEKVNTKDLIGTWKDFQTQKTYHLSSNIQKQLISKFSEFSNQKDPYKENAFLELNNQILKKENEFLKLENQKLKVNQEKLEIDNLNLSINNEKLKNQNKLLKKENEFLKLENEEFQKIPEYDYELE